MSTAGRTLQRLTEHVWWLPPDEPDRPSLCAVVGEHSTLMLDAAASDDHARLFLGELAAHGLPAPRLVALTHWHWDHVFGAAEIGAPVIAHRLTAGELAVQASYEWTDAALDQRVADGTEIAFCADNIKIELPEPRRVRIAPPQVLFDDRIDIDLGGVTCRLQHVGGDHEPDSVVAFVAPDGVLFLGDAFCEKVYTPVRHFTHQRLLPLLDTLLAFGASQVVEGHTTEVITGAEWEALVAKARLAAELVAERGDDEEAVTAAARARGAEPDEDFIDLARSLIAGLGFPPGQ